MPNKLSRRIVESYLSLNVPKDKKTYSCNVCNHLRSKVTIDVAAWWAASPVDARPPGSVGKLLLANAC